MRTHEEKYDLRHYTDPGKGCGHEDSNHGQPVPVHAEKKEGKDPGLLNLVITMFEGNLVHSPTSGLNNVSDFLN